MHGKLEKSPFAQQNRRKRVIRVIKHKPKHEKKWAAQLGGTVTDKRPMSGIMTKKK